MAVLSDFLSMTQLRGGNMVGGPHIPCRLQLVNIPLEMMGRSDIPGDLFDLYSDWYWLSVQRGDYFQDEATSIKYSVYGNPIAAYTDHLEIQVFKYTGPN